MFKVKGLYTALVTPFNAGVVDLVSLRKLIEHQVLGGVDGVVVLGTTGEAPVIRDDERELIISSVMRYVAGRLKVMVGTGSNSTERAIAYTKQAEEMGADCALIAAPYYNKPTQNGLVAHYQAISERVNIPIVLYNVPTRAAVDISDESVVQIAQMKNVIGIKDASGDIERPMRIANMLQKNFAQLTGDDSNVVAFNAHGGVGCISVTANIAPKTCKEIQNLTIAEKYKEALLLQRKMIELHDAMFCETNPGPVKYAAYSLDLIESAELRLPLVNVSENSQKRILSAMHEAKSLLC